MYKKKVNDIENKGIKKLWGRKKLFKEPYLKDIYLLGFDIKGEFYLEILSICGTIEFWKKWDRQHIFFCQNK